MKKFWSIRTQFSIGILLAFVLGAFAPATSTLAATSQARLTVTNRSATALKLYLDGPARYNLKVPAGKTKSYTVDRGKYKYIATGCGITARGTLDMSINKNLVMPVCGGKITTSDVHTEDLGQVLKVVRIEVVNKSTGVSTVVFKGPALYMLTLKKDADRYYTMAKGDYKVTVYACGKTTKYNFKADKAKKFVVTCP